MFDKSRFLFFILIFAIVPSGLLAQNENLGEIDFPTSGSPNAQKHFIQGVLLLHSFEYPDARRAFRHASEIEPGFAMAYWGEAMTWNHPIWNRQYKNQAIAALNKLGKTAGERAAKAPTQREQDFLATLEVLFGEGEKVERDFAYMNAWKKLYEKYPDDLEAASFYALSILGSAQGKREFKTYMRAGAIAQQIFEKNPLHPGAAHYVIHSFDDPIHAPLGLRAAFSYAKIAPDAPHALHMPSHVFMALGMWDESNSSNEASAAAGYKKGQRAHHAEWWLNYGYLQQGRYKEAQKILAKMDDYMAEDARISTRNHLAYMRSSWLVETRRWQTETFSENFELDGLRKQSATCVLLAKGMAAIASGQIEEAEKNLAAMHDLPQPEANYIDDNKTARLMQLELEALVKLEKGEGKTALKLMDEAAALQENMRFEFGPTMPIKPVHELRGEILLKLNQPKAARTAFRNALSRDPERPLSLIGLARAAELAGNATESRQAREQLRLVWKRADPDIVELKEAASND